VRASRFLRRPPLRFRAPDSGGVGGALVQRRAGPVRVVGLGRVVRVVAAPLGVVAPAVLVEPDLDVAGVRARREIACCRGEADLEVVIGPGARRRQRDVGGRDVVAADDGEVALGALGVDRGVDRVPEADRQLRQLHGRAAHVHDLEVRPHRLVVGGAGVGTPVLHPQVGVGRADTAEADVGRLAVGVRRARRLAGIRGAHVRHAVGRRRGLADAGPVAEARRVDGRRAHAAGAHADRARAVEAAGARAVAHAVGAAAGGAHVHALAGRDRGLSGGDVGARSRRRGERARLARPGASRRAADALRAVVARAIAARAARGAVGPLGTDVAHADVRRDAVGVDRAVRTAGGAAAADVRRAARRRAGLAGSGAVARARGGQRRSCAGRSHAGGARDVQPARARAVAEAVGAAGACALGGALGRRDRGLSGGNVGARSRRARDCTRPAGPGTGRQAADALFAEARVALSGGRADRTRGKQAAAAVCAGVRRRAVGGGAAGHPARAAGPARVGRAARRCRGLARPGAVARTRGRERRPRAHRGRALHAGGVQTARAAAVAGAVGAAAIHTEVVALVQRIGAVGHVGASADGTRERARLAGAVAGAVAADALRAEAGQALAACAAGDAGPLLGAAAADAGEGRDAVGVSRAGGPAGCSGARVRVAHRRRRRLASAGTVARPRRRQRRAGAGRRRALSPGGVPAAAAGAVAHAVGAAAVHPLVVALAERIGAGRNVGAGAQVAGDRARLARPRARGRAADPLLAQPGHALGPRVAREAGRLLRAGAHHADVGRGAVGVDAARRLAYVRRTDVGAARLGRRHLAGAGAVARPRRRVRRPGAALLHADRPARVHPAAAAAVARAVVTAGRGVAGRALAQRIVAGGHQRAGAQRCGQAARPARARASRQAAGPLLAEAARAFGRGRARRAVGALAATACVADVGRDAIGVGTARDQAGAGGAAPVRAAIRGGRGAAGPGAVAGARWRERRSAARRRRAGRADRVPAAGAAAVTGAVVAARVAALVGALVERIGAGDDRGARADGAGQAARPADPDARCRAADALLAEGRIAFRRGAAGRADRLLAAAPVDARVRAGAVGVGGAGGPARAARPADVRVAGRQRRRLAGAGAVAGARGRERRPGAARPHAHRARRVQAAASRAVAAPVGAAGRGAVVIALVQRVGADGDERARAGGAGERAGPAGAGAAGAAADALLAETGGALVAAAARRGQRLLGALAGITDVGRDAVAVGRADGQAAGAGGVAGEGAARDRRRGLAGAGPVAGLFRRVAARAAGRRRARGAVQVTAAAAGAVARSVGAAAGGALVVALVQRVLTGGNGRARAARAGQRTRHAVPGARRPAADALRAEPAVAFAARRADGAQWLQAAARRRADVTGRALGVGRAAGEAAGAAADVGRARLRHARRARPRAVAAAGQRLRRSGARLRAAAEARRVEAAGARAVA